MVPRIRGRHVADTHRDVWMLGVVSTSQQSLAGTVTCHMCTLETPVFTETFEFDFNAKLFLTSTE